MGHIIFIFMHLLAVMFGFVFLFITIPLHIIYIAMGAARGTAGFVGGVVRGLNSKDCPYCKKEINAKAVKCPYCRSDVE